MWNFTSKRQSAGNICLVLFTAFLFTILVAPFAMVGQAEASSGTLNPVVESGGSYIDYTEGQSSREVTGTSSGIELLVLLASSEPLTDISHVSVSFVKENGGTVLTVYGTDATTAGNSIYGAVYSLVYLAPNSFVTSADTVVYGKVYYDDVFLYNIILTVNPKPPSGGGGGGGGSTTPTTPATTTTTTTGSGTTVVNTATNSATSTVDTAKVTAMINSTEPVVITAVPTGTSVASVVVDMAASIVSLAADKGKELTIKTDDVQFVIPPAAIPAIAAILQADPNAKVSLNVTEQTKTIPAGNENVQQVGKVFNFELVAQSTSGTTTLSTFSKPLQVAIPYTASDLNGVSEDKLGGYRITVNGLVFLGGTVDKAAKKVTFETGSFSDYVLGAKIAAFADIVKHWAKDDIELLVNKGIVKGMTVSQFAPDSGITRAQFATLLVKALGLTEVKPAKATFKDVKSSAWYYGNVETAAANGLVAGYKGSFSPEGKITREEMAAMVAKALKVGGKTVTVSSGEATTLLGKFSDKQQIAGWASNSVAVAVKEGIITGRTTSTFVAKANATRAEGTVMIKKVLSSLGKL